MTVRLIGPGCRSLAAFLLLLGVASPAAAERPRVYALTHATVIKTPGQTLEDATVVIRDGLIEKVGPDAKIPPDATEIDAEGLWIYPGLIDPNTELGLKREGEDRREQASGMAELIAAMMRSRRESPSGAAHPISRVHPERQARDRLVSFEGDRKREVERYRNLGFTAALAAPSNGIFRGLSVAILLKDDAPVPDLILKDDVAQHVGFERGRFGQGYPTSLMGAVAAIRQCLLDSQRYLTWDERYSSDPVGMRRPDFIAAYDSLEPVLNGSQQVVFTLEDPYDFVLSDRLAREFGLEAVMSGSGHEWEIADRVAASGRKLILPVGFPDKPKVDEDHEALDVSLREMRRYLEAPAGPGTLHEAGAEFAFTTRGLKNLADFYKNLRLIIQAGLPEETALAALTTVPASILGLDAVLGTIEPGKIANLFATDGPLFEKDTKVERIFVDGVEYRVEKKEKPKGDPTAVVDPRGEWSVVFEFGTQTVQRTWNIKGERGNYTGTAETRSGTVEFDRVELEGNALTVVFPARGSFGPVEITVIIEGDSFEGVAEMGPRSIPVKGTRTIGPEGGGR